MRKKKWTVLMYLNGNNELGVEMENTFLDVKNMADKEDINIIIQLSKGSIDMVNMIRSNNVSYDENWNGVRRYSLINGVLKLEQSFDYLNMVDYKNLYKFIEWGMTNFNSDRYMVIISGHGFITDVMTDFEGDRPYSMGVYEMCYALNNIKKELNKQIDVLLLDMCTMNYLEFFYELGKDKNNTVKNVLTYIENGPLEGIRYSEIFDKLNDNDTETILKNIVEDSKYTLAAFKIDHKKLEKIRYECNELGKKLKSIEENRENYQKNYKNYIDEIDSLSKKLVINYKKKRQRIPIVRAICFEISVMPPQRLKEFLKDYYKLAFVNNSYCINMISKNSPELLKTLITPKIEQKVLSKSDLRAIVEFYNMNMSRELVLEIVNKICVYKEWISLEYDN